MTDKTNYIQALMHMVKGNLGAGIMGMPASFAHTGLIGGTIGLPILCLISAYCVQLLLRSSIRLEAKYKGKSFDYASLAEHSFRSGPRWTQSISGHMSRFVDGILLVTQIGVCCVYIVFVVDNITSILASYKIQLAKSLVFVAIFPFMLILCFIKTLRRLAIASMVANLLQAIGLAIILEYLLRDLGDFDLSKRHNFMPLKDMALGFGSAMFAFEGISVVLPIYGRLKRPSQMPGCFGVANLSFVILLILYFLIGLFGYLRFGHRVRDSITLNLPAEPLYDVVRAMFTTSILLTYPLQFYVPNEICWNWVKNNLLMNPVLKANLRHVAPNVEVVVAGLKQKQQAQLTSNQQSSSTSVNTLTTISGSTVNLANTTVITNPTNRQEQLKATDQDQAISSSKNEYYCRTLLVFATFTIAYSVPKLNLLMDLIGSMSGTLLSLTIPATIHLVTFCSDSRGLTKAMLIIVDGLIIAFSLLAGFSGSAISFVTILSSFHK